MRILLSWSIHCNVNYHGLRSGQKRDVLRTVCIAFSCLCTSGTNLVENGAFVYMGHCILVVFCEHSNKWPKSVFAFYFYLNWVRSLLDYQAKFSWFVILCWHIWHTHLPSSTQSQLSTCCCSLMGFTASFPSQQSVPPRVQPPPRVCAFALSWCCKWKQLCCVLLLHL